MRWLNPVDDVQWMSKGEMGGGRASFGFKKRSGVEIERRGPVLVGKAKSSVVCRSVQAEKACAVEEMLSEGLRGDREGRKAVNGVAMKICGALASAGRAVEGTAAGGAPLDHSMMPALRRRPPSPRLPFAATACY